MEEVIISVLADLIHVTLITSGLLISFESLYDTYINWGDNMAKKKQTPKARNWLAIRAFQRSGAGSHGDEKKKRDKYRCRGKVREEG